MSPIHVMTGHGFAYDDDAYEAFIAWAEQQPDLPEDESDQMDLWEAHLSEQARERS
jgi:hypothetical protein